MTGYLSAFDCVLNTCVNSTASVTLKTYLCCYTASYKNIHTDMQCI